MFACSNQRFSVAMIIAIWDFSTCFNYPFAAAGKGYFHCDVARYSYPDWPNCTLEQCQWVPWAGEAGPIAIVAGEIAM